MYEEIIALRSLAVELDKAKLTSEDARQGVRITNKFSKLGIDPDKHLDLVRVCKEIGNPEFVHSTIRLMEIEHGSGLSYRETIKRFEEAAQGLPAAEAKIQKMQDYIENLNQKIINKKQKSCFMLFFL